MRLRLTLLERFFELLSQLNSQARLRLRCGGLEFDAQGVVGILAALILMIALMTIA